MQTSWDKDGDGAFRNLVVTTTLQLGAVTLTPPATAGTLATLAGTETLTNKTLTSPTENSPAINTGTLTVFNMTPGASTAAAGSTSVDAGALPAGTASLYPTTAADDATGVIISTSDKVTGRTLFIGNGVANKVLKIYAPAGGTINGASANAAFSSASGKGVIIVCLSGSGNTWLAF